MESGTMFLGTWTGDKFAEDGIIIVRCGLESGERSSSSN